jgi:hypothetical protein
MVEPNKKTMTGKVLQNLKEMQIEWEGENGEDIGEKRRGI